MPRILSPNMVAAVHGQTTDEVLLLTLRIKHQSIPEGGVLRFVRNFANITVTTAAPGEDPDRIGEYIATSFEASLPDDLEGRSPVVTLEIVNVDRKIVDTIRVLDPRQAPPLLCLEAVLASSPNTIEVAVNDIVLRRTEWDALLVRGDLSSDDPLNEPYPSRAITPVTCPGLFRIPV